MPDGFFFLEMNTRLQVEHPVTEMITGFDLVEWQLRVAAGEALPVTQVGDHAIRPRHRGAPLRRGSGARFCPVGRPAGAVPHAGTDRGNVRIDTGFVTGDTVSIHYDAMLAKLICHGATRDAALRRMRQALADSAVVGVASNLDLLGRIAAHPEFVAGGVDTGFIAREAGSLLADAGPPTPEVLAIAALVVLDLETEAASQAAALSSDPHSPWHERDLWWLNTEPARVLEFADGASEWPVSVTRDKAGWRIETDGQTIIAASEQLDAGRLRVSLDGAWRTVTASQDQHIVTVRDNGLTWRLTLPDPLASADDEEDAGDRLVAPIPGQVTQVAVSPGDKVTRGQVLVVLEAMKTVFRLSAPADTVVAAVSCSVGEMVQEDKY